MAKRCNSSPVPSSPFKKHLKTTRCVLQHCASSGLMLRSSGGVHAMRWIEEEGEETFPTFPLYIYHCSSRPDYDVSSSIEPRPIVSLFRSIPMAGSKHAFFKSHTRNQLVNIEMMTIDIECNALQTIQKIHFFIQVFLNFLVRNFRAGSSIHKVKKIPASNEIHMCTGTYWVGILT